MSRSSHSRHALPLPCPPPPARRCLVITRPLETRSNPQTLKPSSPQALKPNPAQAGPRGVLAGRGDGVRLLRGVARVLATLPEQRKLLKVRLEPVTRAFELFGGERRGTLPRRCRQSGERCEEGGTAVRKDGRKEKRTEEKDRLCEERGTAVRKDSAHVQKEAQPDGRAAWRRSCAEGRGGVARLSLSQCNALSVRQRRLAAQPCAPSRTVSAPR
jgi:hypothetical protein